MPYPTRNLLLAAAVLVLATGSEPAPGLAQLFGPPAEEQPFGTLSEPEGVPPEGGRLRGRIDSGEEEDANGRRSRRRPDGLRGTASPDGERAADPNALVDGFADPLIGLSDPEQEARRPLGVDEELPLEVVEEDPYAPIGMRLGSFLLFPELLSETVYKDNLFLSPNNPEGDWALSFTPSLAVRSDWNRHSLEATLGAVRSYHQEFSSEDDKTDTARLAGRLDIRRGTKVKAEAGYARFLEDRSSIDFPANAVDRPEEIIRDALLEGNHTFNRVTFTLRGEISEQDFGDSLLTDGTVENNDDRDYTERRLTSRAAYEFQPGVSAFAEASANTRDFAQPVDDDGVRSNSSGHDVQGGLMFQLSGKLTGEASAGYAIQKPEDPTLKDIDGLIFNAGLEWKASGLTTVRFDASSEVAETAQIGSAGSIVRDAELSVEHRPRRHVVLGAAVGYERETFSGSNEVDQEWAVGLSGEYLFSPSVALVVDYEHLKHIGSGTNDDYRTNEVRLGLRLRR